ncbi:uncharacterized protein LOC106013787 [Aplysia californica]|uniref:Uncharacterized protein LOC106013787 n=1 Tax=Aplysia californica TaxID=6500 RepID=A0ABM1AE06_APLCA|nr:uncharacterized protein LOC106013787 [Aplysia californica]
MTTTQMFALLVCVGVACVLPRPAASHGRLYEPPGRSTMWRRGYDTEENYDDNQLFCGGFWHQFTRGYKCGVCGDPVDGPLDNEPGGKYATGQITRTYTEGQLIHTTVQVTANHLGYFEFRLCEANDPNLKVNQSCFDQNLLEIVESGGTRDYIGSARGDVNLTLRLPAHVTCSFCTIQWKYHTGNSWGTDPDGKQCIGCGPQEEFYGCSDVKIVASGGRDNQGGSSTGSPSTQGAGSTGNPNTQRTSSIGNPNTQGASSTGNPNTQGTSSTGNPNTQGTSSTRNPIPETSPTPQSSSSSPTGSSRSETTATGGGVTGGGAVQYLALDGTVAMDAWCQYNCPLDFCPDWLCYRAAGARNTPAPASGCRAIGPYANSQDMQDWCVNNCALDNCPPNMCACN